MDEKVIKVLIECSRQLGGLYFEALDIDSDPARLNPTCPMKSKKASEISAIQCEILRIAESAGYVRKRPKPNATLLSWRKAGDGIAFLNQEN